jgi:hypothetical protein
MLLNSNSELKKELILLQGDKSSKFVGGVGVHVLHCQEQGILE